MTGGVDAEYLRKLENTRADNIKGRAITGGLGPLEGKGGGGAVAKVNGNGVNGHAKAEPESHPDGDLAMSAARANGDDTVGLHNSWKL